MSFAKLPDRYKFYLEVFNTAGGMYEVTPLEQSLTWEFEKESKLGIKRRKLATKLTFYNNANRGITDFDVIKAEIEDPNTQCVKRKFEVHHSCDGLSYTKLYDGAFRANMCEFDYDKCNVLAEIEINDGIACMLQDNNIQVWQGYDDAITAHLELIEYKDCVREVTDYDMWVETVDPTGNGAQYLVENYAPQSDCIPGGEAYTLIEHSAFFDADPKDPDPPFKFRITTKWARLKRTTAPPDLYGWIAISGAWVRPVPLAEYTYFNEPISGYRFYDGKMGKKWRIYDYPYYPTLRDRGQWPGVEGGWGLRGTINGLIRANCEATLSYRSEFFKWNETGDFPDNEAYSFMHDLLDKGTLTLFDMTDFAGQSDRYVGYTLANYPKIDVIQFLQSLQVVFNLGFDFDPVTNKLIIEHISFFDRDRRIDLTSDELRKYIRGGHKWSYDNNVVPKVEKYNWAMDSSISFDMSITYSGSCVDPENKEEQHIAQLIYTDIRYISDIRTADKVGVGRYGETYQAVALDTPFNNPSDPLLLLTLVDADGYIYWNWNYPRANGSLAYKAMEILYHWERPLLSGVIDEYASPSSFKTARKVRKQVPLSVPICCDDVTNMRSNILVKSQMGWGAVEKLTINDPPGEMTIELIHDRNSLSSETPTT